MPLRSPIGLLARPAQAQLRRWVLSAFPRDPKTGIDYDQPLGDPGLFGPDSATWRVNGDFPGMLSGGLCALMLQTLHPRALAGVWDHSNFRDDLVGRLRRTTAFVGGTSYAPLAEAQGLIDKVRTIHTRVRGQTADGQAYAADDPALLTWVHVTEAYSFLQGYRRYAGVTPPAGAGDRYFDEMRRVAESLGARDVPRSEAEVDEYFAQVRGQLRYDERSRIVLEILRRIRLPVPMAGLSRDLFLGAGAALLPAWASEMLGQGAADHRRARVCAATLRAMAPVFRAALQDGVVSRSCRRVGLAPEHVLHW